LPTSYDEVGYPCAPQTQTHPDVLAALAALYGLTPPPPGRCSVLEIGCSDGSNLIPMAANDPASQFTGIDLAGTAIDAARAFASRLGLNNIEFAQADITTWNPAGRRFDYIIIHGVYSWVPDTVREAILARCRESLAPDGVAYISYNALPGCHLRRYVWDALRYATRAIADPHQKVAAAREYAQTMGARLEHEPAQAAMRNEFERLLTLHESVLLHDDLTEHNTPFYLTDFVAAAERHGLQYICDARFSRDAIPDPAVGGDWLAARQSADFVNGVRFRCSLLCHKEVAVGHVIRPERVMQLSVASPADPEPAQTDGTQRFRLGGEQSLATNHPVAKQILTELAQLWPRAVPVAKLPSNSLDHESCVALILRLYEARAVELRLREPRLVAAPSAQPVASPLARLQIESGLQTVTSQRHASVVMTDEVSRQCLLLLDGSRDRAALVRDLTNHFDPEKSGSAGSPAAWHGAGPASRMELALRLDQGLDRNLAEMARLGLLIR